MPMPESLKPFYKSLAAQHRYTREAMQALDDGDAAVSKACAQLAPVMADVEKTWPIQKPTTPPVVTPPPVTPPVVTPPTQPPITPPVTPPQQPGGATQGPLKFMDGGDVIVVSGPEVKAEHGAGVVCDGKDIAHLIIETSITAQDYCVYANNVGSIDIKPGVLLHTTGGGPDPYVVRAVLEPYGQFNVHADAILSNVGNPGKEVCRVTGFGRGEIAGKLSGGVCWWGMGYKTDGNVAEHLDTQRLWVHDTYIKCIDASKNHAQVLGTKTHNFTYENVDFLILPGKGVFSLWCDGEQGKLCRGHKAINCRVARCDAQGSRISEFEPLGWQHFQGGQSKNSVAMSIVNPLV